MQSLTQTDIWQALVNHQRSFENIHLRDLFNDDPQRFRRSTHLAPPGC